MVKDALDYASLPENDKLPYRPCRSVNTRNQPVYQCNVSGYVKTQPHVYAEKKGLERPACHSDAGSDKTGASDATVSINAKGLVFLVPTL